MKHPTVRALATPLLTCALVASAQVEPPAINIKDHGAVCNFDPATGVGHDDRAAIQAALDEAVAKGGARVQLIRGGRCYLGTGYQFNAKGLRAQLAIGSNDKINAAAGVVLDGNEATLYQGNEGAALFIGNASSIMVRGLRMVGYAGNPLGAWREYDNLVLIANKSRNVTVENCYLTNSLGWIIAIQGNVTVAGGGSTYTPKNIRIVGNTIKERYGNGTRSPAGGSRTQNAIQAVDVDGLTIRGNTIYGRVDLEPNNLAANAPPDNGHQHILNVDVSGNNFKSGFVTPQSTIGKSYWLDEPLGKKDGPGGEIDQSIALQGLDHAPIVRAVTFHENNFEHGTIYLQGQSTQGNSAYRASVRNNTFHKGKIIVGHNSADNVNKGFIVSRNTAVRVTDNSNGFIEFRGNVSSSQFLDNTLTEGGKLPVIGKGGTGAVGDAGQNRYCGNVAARADRAIGLSIAATSTAEESCAPRRR